MQLLIINRTLTCFLGNRLKRLVSLPSHSLTNHKNAYLRTTCPVTTNHSTAKISIQFLVPKYFLQKLLQKKEERGGALRTELTYYSCKDMIKYTIIIPRSKIFRGIENNTIPFSKIFPTKNIAKKRE